MQKNPFTIAIPESTLTDLRDHTSLADPASDAVAHLLQLIGNDLRRAVKLEANLGVHVEIATPYDEVF